MSLLKPVFVTISGKKNSDDVWEEERDARISVSGTFSETETVLICSDWGKILNGNGLIFQHDNDQKDTAADKRLKVTDLFHRPAMPSWAKQGKASLFL